MTSSEPQSGDGRTFATTRWSVVLAAGNPADAACSTALQQLCQAYWYPLYAYARRRGANPDLAADQTQEFFVKLLERQSLQTVDPQRGRFRAFLITLFQRFLVSEYTRELAMKRGGGTRPLSIDATEGESRYQFEPASELTAEKLFERRWALELLDQVLRRLESEYQQKGKGGLFQACKPALAGGELNTAQVCATLGLNETALRVTVHRLRQRYRELLHLEILQTVDSPQDVADELQRLRDAIQGH